MNQPEITAVYCICDEFCQHYDGELRSRGLGEQPRRRRRPRLHDAEVMSIAIWFHIHRCRDFRSFYCRHVCVHMRQDFPRLVSYARFVELVQRVLPRLTALQAVLCLGSCTGATFIDSTSIRVCRNQRSRSNRVFRELAALGRTSMGWFFGFKLHLALSHRGHIVGWRLTPGNVADTDTGTVMEVCKAVRGRLFGDRGYISSKLSQTLAQAGIRLVSRSRGNMKNRMMPLQDRLLLRKRGIIETVFGQLKNLYQIEHSRHRSFTNFQVNIAAALLAYSFQTKKPAIRIQGME